MSASRVLRDALEAGVQLWANGDQLGFRLTEGELDPDLKRALKSHKTEILALLGDAGDRYCLPSFAQQRLWFLDQLAPGNAAYNIPFTFHLEGRLHLAALEHTLTRLVERHEPLRTTFALVEEQLVQVVHPPAPRRVPVLDLRRLPASRRQAEARRLAAEEALRPFDLRTGPLMRVSLLRLAAGEHTLLVNLHHTITDTWSMAIFFDELAVLYNAALDGEDVGLQALPMRYADFAVWQRRWLTGDHLATQLAFWKRLVGTEPPILELATDRPRPPVQRFRGRMSPLALPAGLSDALRALGRDQGATLAMTTMAGFFTLLYRYTGQPRILMGTPIAGRNRSEFEGLVGFFINLLIMAGDFSPGAGGRGVDFHELLRRVKEMSLAAYNHQDLPFEKLVEELGGAREPSRNPLFQVVFLFQNTPEGNLEIRDLKVGDEPWEVPATRFDLELHLWDSPRGLEGFVAYDVDLFDATTIARLERHYQRLLESIVARPGSSVAELAWLTSAEEHQLRVEWKGGASSQRLPAATLAELFEAQVKRDPRATALRTLSDNGSPAGDRTLSYAELNARANRLADHLEGLGVTAGSLVAVRLERGPELVCALLAAVKAGAAYLPLDLAYPRERVQLMLADSGAEWLLTTTDRQRELGRFSSRGTPSVPPVTTVLLDELLPALAADPDAAVDRPAAGHGTDPLAYVMYTSGSTGRPKGIAVSHSAIVRLVCDTDYLRLGPRDRVAQASNASFDAATFEIWGALLSGSELVILPPDTILSPADLAAALRRQRIDTLFLTTALFNQVARQAPGAFSCLRDLLFGGEAVDPRWVREVLASGAPRRLLHVYGPTENTTFSTWQRVERVPEGARTVPIGGAVAHSTCLVLDRGRSPVPVGVTGELYVAGKGLAQGYLNRPGLTAEHFVADPRGGVPGARTYRTGDLVRWRAEGTLDFLGRGDHQVKIRGFRIELGEIETLLRAHPRVEDALVTVLEQEDEKQLLGYVIARGAESEPAGAERRRNREKEPDAELGRLLQAELRRSLPDYMVPSAVVVLASWPLTANGKVDRRQLPVPSRSHRLGEVYVAPRNETTRALAAIWEEVLGLDRVGEGDDFFALGGHSLMATQVMSRTCELFDVDIAVRTLFDAPRLADLGLIVQTLLTKSERATAVTATPGEEREEMLL